MDDILGSLQARKNQNTRLVSVTRGLVRRSGTVHTCWHLPQRRYTHNPVRVSPVAFAALQTGHSSRTLSFVLTDCSARIVYGPVYVKLNCFAM